MSRCTCGYQRTTLGISPYLPPCLRLGLSLLFTLFVVWVCAGGEVKGQLAGISPLLPPCRFQGLNLRCEPGLVTSAFTHLLSHLVLSPLCCVFAVYTRLAGPQDVDDSFSTSCLPIETLGYRCVLPHPAFCRNAGDLSSGPLACTVGPLRNEPSPPAFTSGLPIASEYLQVNPTISKSVPLAFKLGPAPCRLFLLKSAPRPTHDSKSSLSSSLGPLKLPSCVDIESFYQSRLLLPLGSSPGLRNPPP